MKTIPVIFAKNSKPISLLIRLWTWSRWSHVGIITQDGLSVIESVGGKGVIITPLHEFKARYTAYEECHLPCISETAVYQAIRGEIGKPYDMSAIFGIVFRRDWDKQDAWFCSELVAHASGIFRTKMIKRITPECLWRISF